MLRADKMDCAGTWLQTYVLELKQLQTVALQTHHVILPALDAFKHLVLLQPKAFKCHVLSDP